MTMIAEICRLLAGDAADHLPTRLFPLQVRRLRLPKHTQDRQLRVASLYHQQRAGNGRLSLFALSPQKRALYFILLCWPMLIYL